MWAGGPFPLFHYKIGSFSSHYLSGTTIKNCIKACLGLFFFLSCNNNINVDLCRLESTEGSMIALLTHELALLHGEPVHYARITVK